MKERQAAEPIKDEASRVRALEAVAADESVAAIAPLVAALGDSSWRVRQVAVHALARRGGKEVIGAVLNAMEAGHQDLAILNAAIQVLGNSGMDAIPALREFLNHPNADLRGHAAVALGNSGDPRAVAALVGALKDPDPNVCFQAVDALKALRAGEAAEALAAIAESGDFFLSFAALDALGAVGDTRMSPRIVLLLDDPQLRAAAIEALGRAGDEEAVAPLAAILNEKGVPAAAVARALLALRLRHDRDRNSDYLIGQARKAIGSEGTRNLIAALERATGDDARALAGLLGWLGGDTAIAALASLLGRPGLTDEVAEALVFQGTAATEAVLRQLEAAADLEGRRAAVRVLGQIGDRAAVSALLHALHPEDGLTEEAAASLAMLGDLRAYPPLRELMGHADIGVRRAVVGAVNSLGHPSAASDAALWLDHPNPLLRESAVRVTGYAGAPNCADRFLACCQDSDEIVRRTAVEHLPYLDDPRAGIALHAAFRDPCSSVRAAAARAIVNSNDADEVELLRNALEDPDPWVRYYAARSIRPNARPLVADLTLLALHDVAPQVRIAAIEALGRLAEPATAEVLDSLSQHVNADVARAALHGLAALPHPDALPPLRTALQSSDPQRRREALRAIRDHLRVELVDAVRHAADDADADVASMAIEVLGHLPVPEAADALATHSVLPRRRDICTISLALLAKNDPTLLTAALGHPHPDVRRAVVEGLSRATRPEARAMLTHALGDADASVRHAALMALAQAARGGEVRRARTSRQGAERGNQSE